MKKFRVGQIVKVRYPTDNIRIENTWEISYNNSTYVDAEMFDIPGMLVNIINCNPRGVSELYDYEAEWVNREGNIKAAFFCESWLTKHYEHNLDVELIL